MTLMLKVKEIYILIARINSAKAAKKAEEATSSFIILVKLFSRFLM